MSDFNRLQILAMEYCLAGGTRKQRLDALSDLQTLGVFKPSADERGTQAQIEDYLNRNPRGFCQDGVNRFRTHLGLPIAPETRTVRVTLDIDFSAVGKSGLSTFLPGGDSDYRVPREARHHLAGYVFRQTGSTDKITFEAVRVVCSQVHPV